MEQMSRAAGEVGRDQWLHVPGIHTLASQEGLRGGCDDTQGERGGEGSQGDARVREAAEAVKQAQEQLQALVAQEKEERALVETADKAEARMPRWTLKKSGSGSWEHVLVEEEEEEEEAV